MPRFDEESKKDNLTVSDPTLILILPSETLAKHVFTNDGNGQMVTLQSIRLSKTQLSEPAG